MTENMGQVDIIEKNRRMNLEMFNKLTKSEADMIRRDIHKEINKFFHGSVEKIRYDEHEI